MKQRTKLRLGAAALTTLSVTTTLTGCTDDAVVDTGRPSQADGGVTPQPPVAEAGTRRDATAPIVTSDAGADAGDSDVLDASPGDAGDAAEAGPPVDTLASTGLYAPGGGEVLAAGVIEYQVRFPLWSDGATKRRFLYLPPDGKIDTSDMDGWVFPVGTRAWKEFTRDGKRVETRLLEKTGAGTWKHVAYAWNADQTEAVAVPDGAPGALGTPHDIPTSFDCESCHLGSRDFLLGVSAIQLAHDGPGVTLQSLMAADALTAPPASSSMPLPGSVATQAALGVLHANCGGCHRPGTFAFERNQMELYLTVASLASATETPAYKTAVGVATTKVFDDATARIAPGDPAHSALYQRMTSREPLMAMPPLATKIVDQDGAQAVSDWITSLAP